MCDDDDDMDIGNWAYIVHAITITGSSQLWLLGRALFTFPHHNHCTFWKLSSFTSPISNL
ncbi:hypothetical protein N7453_005804 [Penicillium expansum]|nr:hypothetical protein N7453_005804 [Penicillium expansum]